MGWRLRKHYYTVKHRQNAKQELLLAWVEFGPDKHLQDKDIQSVFKSLASLRHNHIEPVVHQHVTDKGALMIRNFYTAGSLRDILCVTKPKQPFIKKYGNPKQTKSFATAEIANYGYQVKLLSNLYLRNIQIILSNYIVERDLLYRRFWKPSVFFTRRVCRTVTCTLEIFL